MHTRMIDNEIRLMRQENLRLAHEREGMVEKIADNTQKIKQNKVLPYLVSKVVEVGRAFTESHLAPFTFA
jgi:26S proteasome regulatory subunit T5